MSRKVVIVGGVAGGASAAARLRRLDEFAEIILLEQGPHVSFANCGLPYYVGGVIKKRDKLLVQTPKSLRDRFRIDVRVGSRVTEIDPAEKTVTVMNLADGSVYAESYDQLILSPGASPIRPPIEGLDHPSVFTLRSLEDADRIKEFIKEKGPKKAIVVGGGFIGVEMMENLAEAGLDVECVEASDQVLQSLDPEMAAIVHRDMEKHGVTLTFGTGLTEIRETPEGSLDCVLIDGSVRNADLALVCIGIRPDHELARMAGLALGPRGSIEADEMLMTSAADVYAVGDAITVRNLVTGEKSVIPLAGPANRQGRLAAGNVVGLPQAYRGTLGTSVAKIFDLAAGSTGASEKQLKEAGRAYDKVYLHPNSHAVYYPGSKVLSMKLLFDPADGKVLGAQAIGEEGAEKRIDVIAAAIYAGLTVHDLENLELSYAPPFSSAKDPVNMAGFTASNVLKGDFRQFFIEDLAHRTSDDFLVDARTPAEYKDGTIEDAVNIPLDEIRDRLDEFPKDKRIIVFCRSGLRSYIACRILSQRGFGRVSNLSGGYLTWEPVFGPREQ